MAHEWGLDLDTVKKMSRREISESLEAIQERKNNYKNSSVAISLTEEQEVKIEKAIKERLENVKNNYRNKW